jgi:hypothetical protein
MVMTNEVQLKQFYKIEEANAWLASHDYEFLGVSYSVNPEDVHLHWVVVAYRMLV